METDGTKGAAALVIGDEILTGKIQEKNVAFLGRRLFELGLRLRRVVVCGDDVETIASELRALRAAYPVVFTSGGVGPTHDDVTLEGVARALGRPLVRDPGLVELIRGHFGDATTEAHLRMADVPEGAELVKNERMPWPTVFASGVYVMPGVPQIFEMKFAVLEDRLRRDVGWVSRAIFTRYDEFELAPLLEEIVAAHPAVDVGSYPRFRDDVDHTVKLTVDGTDPDAVDRAVEALLSRLDPDRIVRVG